MSKVTPIVSKRTKLLREIAQDGDQYKCWVLVAEDENGELMIPDGDIDVEESFSLLARAAVLALKQVQETWEDDPQAS